MPHPNEEVFDVEANTLRRRGTELVDHILPDKIRNGLVIVLGEFFGTFLFLLLSFIGAQTAINNNDPFNPKTPLLPMSLLYIASSFGTALAVNVWIFYRVTGGMFNPAVTLGLVLVGAVKPLRALLIVPTQLVAGIAAAAAVNGMLPGPLKVANTLGDKTTAVQGLFLEVFLTSQLVLTVYLLAVEKHRATHLAPVAIGISVFVAHLAGTFYTGTSLNPARSLGPAVLVGFTTYHWIYWAGPILGALLAFVVYSVLKILDYKTANPGQDMTNPGQDMDNLNKANTLSSPDAAAISSIATSEANFVGSTRPKTRDSNSMFSEGDSRAHQTHA